MIVSNKTIYFASLIENIRFISGGVLIFGSVCLLIAPLLIEIFEDYIIPIAKRFCVVLLFSVAIITFTPNEEAMKLMVINSVITQESIDMTGKTAQDIIDYISNKVVSVKRELKELDE